MKLRPLGRTGVRVPPICLGTMTFGGQCDEATSFAIMDKAFDMGVDFFDTADAYPMGQEFRVPGETEAVIGRWMKERGLRDRIFLATKCRMPMGPTVNDSGLSRYNIQRAVDASLKRLQTDVIDLYQVHAFDPHTPIDETLRALDDLVHAGKVRYLGCSNFPAWRLADALGESARLGLARFESLQPRYNMLYREIETELLPLCRDKQISNIVYNPIAGGVLSGKYKPGQSAEDSTRFNDRMGGQTYRDRYWEDTQLALVNELDEACKARGLDLPSVAVAWVLAQPGITSAIVGASRPDQLDATVAGAELVLDDELKSLCDDIWWRLPRKPVQEGYR